MKLALSILLCSMLTAMAPQTFSGATLKGMSSSPVVISNDPVFNSVIHVWHLEEAAGNSRVDSVGVNNLTEVNGTVARGTGKHGNAVDFSTAGHWLHDPTGAGGLGDARSESFWINLRTLPASSKIYAIQSLPASPSPLSSVIWIDHSGVVHFIADGFTGESPEMTGSLGSLNAWHMVVVIAGGASCSLSIDGGTFSTSASSGLAINDTDSPDFGAVIAGESADVVPDGLVDEIVVWNVELTQGNVTTLYGGGTNPVFYSP